MRILLIGGNGFIGQFAVAALQQQGHALAVFHRGTTDAPAGVDEILGDRNQLKASAQQLKHFAPDVVIDLVKEPPPCREARDKDGAPGYCTVTVTYPVRVMLPLVAVTMMV